MASRVPRSLSVNGTGDHHLPGGHVAKGNKCKCQVGAEFTVRSPSFCVVHSCQPCTPTWLASCRPTGQPGPQQGHMGSTAGAHGLPPSCPPAPSASCKENSKWKPKEVQGTRLNSSVTTLTYNEVIKEHQARTCCMIEIAKAETHWDYGVARKATAYSTGTHGCQF